MMFLCFKLTWEQVKRTTALAGCAGFPGKFISISPHFLELHAHFSLKRSLFIFA